MPNANLRHVYSIEYMFHIFWAVLAAFGLQFENSTQKCKKKFEKLQSGYQKTQKFTLIVKQLNIFIFSISTQTGWILTFLQKISFFTRFFLLAFLILYRTVLLALVAILKLNAA
jgi:hypothetical protein